jgi:hypothetical protein
LNANTASQKIHTYVDDGKSIKDKLAEIDMIMDKVMNQPLPQPPPGWEIYPMGLEGSDAVGEK